MGSVIRSVIECRVAPTRLCMLFGALAVVDATSAAAQLRLEPASRSFWTASTLLVSTALVIDEQMRDLMLRQRTSTLDNAALMVDPLGRARYLVPALVGAYVIPRVVGAHAVADAALRVGIGYAVADGIESILKPVVGRHRPDPLRDPFDLRFLSSGEQWHSFPSAHTVHAFSIAAGVADEVGNPWVSAIAFGTAGVVGAQRVYTSAHWTSDVVASAVLAISATTTTTRWLRRRECERRKHCSGGAH